MDQGLFKKFNHIIGCDEVGRGPLAGPVTACAVRLSKNQEGLLEILKELSVTDSKKLSTKKRNFILEQLNINPLKIQTNKAYLKTYKGFSFSFAIQEHSCQEIDSMNILAASLSAMKKASDLIIKKKSIVLIDGNKSFESLAKTQSVIKGDGKSFVIGLASILAKVYRDEQMKKFDLIYPGYNFSKHAGYPTKLHRKAIKELGITPIHRKSFKGVKEYILLE